MGCFSWICPKCKRGVNSDSSTGEDCKLIAFKEGVRLEEMRGHYDSYGRVFIPGTISEQSKRAMEFYESNPPDAMFGVPQILPESQQWSIGWDTVCHLEWDDPHIMSGLAAYHVGCLEGVNESDIRCSESDANQGWGSYPDPGGQVHFHHTVFPAGQDLIDGKGEVSLE